MHKEQITRLYKWEKKWEQSKQYYTRKSFKNKELSPYLMRSWKARSEIRMFENRRYRRNKFSIDNWKKYWVEYRWSIW